MKTLLIAGAIAAGLGFSIPSQAEHSVFGVNVPASKTEVRDNIRGGYVAQSLSDTFVVQTLSGSSENKSEAEEADNNYYVFGVKVDGGRSI